MEVLTGVNDIYEKIKTFSPNFSLTFGLVVFAGVVITAPVSGANLNPAVTVGLFAAGRVKLIRALLYIAVQCLGGIGKMLPF